MQVARRVLMCILMFCATSGIATAQEALTVTGLVTTRVDGLPVSGAVVSVVGADATATTDAAGRYSLQVPRRAARGDRIQLQVDAPGLARVSTEVVVTGAGAHRRRGAVSDVHRDGHGRIACGGKRRRTRRSRRRHHARPDCGERLHRDGAGDPVARAVLQLPEADDHRRHRHGAPGDAARPGARSGAGAHQRQAAPPERARASERQHRPRLDRRGPERHPALGHRSHRGAARRRRRAVRVRRHRRRHQHRAQGRRVAAGGDDELRPVEGLVRRQPLHRGRPGVRRRRRHRLLRRRAGRRRRLVGRGRRQGQRDGRRGVPAPQPHEPRVVRSARPDRRRRRRQQRSCRSRTTAGAIPTRAT